MNIINDFVSLLENEFIIHSNSAIAIEQKAYMQDKFEFFGIKTPERRKIQKPFLDKNHLPDKTEAFQIIQKLWLKPQREFQYFSQELALRYIDKLEEKDMDLFESMIQNKSWWDTVDFIATKLVGPYFKKFPQQRDIYTEKWIASKNIWSQRSSLLFQLNYKNEIDQNLLSDIILSLNGTNEFFINKAIGWILRQYSRYNSEWVEKFVSSTSLHSLSQKEALRLLNS